jgi:cell fate (sporulation/competence/biofilm development) regulator YmcA (YheA/YmcA/DUF963 family)
MARKFRAKTKRIPLRRKRDFSIDRVMRSTETFDGGDTPVFPYNTSMDDVKSLEATNLSDFDKLENREHEILRKLEELKREKQEALARIEKEEAMKSAEMKVQALAKESDKIRVNNPNELMMDYNIETLKYCPKCARKLKRSRVKIDYDTYSQVFKCKKCGFEKEVKLRI